MSLKAFSNTKDTVWNLQDEHTNERTAMAFLRVDEQRYNLWKKNGCQKVQAGN
ncbi:hypothetical protein KSP40_PGU016339 [Platanthera guangdongensis]|uniref:Uncharacterized protein n=1 Tax=Platanthera guangdongensis TaxID=2320717 RepID=A0ABR2M1A7_9ASPA